MVDASESIKLDKGILGINFEFPWSNEVDLDFFPRVLFSLLRGQFPKLRNTAVDSLADITCFANCFDNRTKLWFVEMGSDGIEHTAGARMDEHSMEPFDDGTKEGVRNDDFPIGRIFIWAELGKLIVSMAMVMADWVITDGSLQGLGGTLVFLNILESNRANGIHSVLHRIEQVRFFESGLCPSQ